MSRALLKKGDHVYIRAFRGIGFTGLATVAEDQESKECGLKVWKLETVDRWIPAQCCDHEAVLLSKAGDPKIDQMVSAVKRGASISGEYDFRGLSREERILIDEAFADIDIDTGEAK